jgi:translocator protein
MDILVWGIIYLSWENINEVSLLLLPYISWISFASYLNYYIWTNNSEDKLKGK